MRASAPLLFNSQARAGPPLANAEGLGRDRGRPAGVVHHLNSGVGPAGVPAALRTLIPSASFPTLGTWTGGASLSYTPTLPEPTSPVSLPNPPWMLEGARGLFGSSSTMWPPGEGTQTAVSSLLGPAPGSHACIACVHTPIHLHACTYRTSSL